MNEMNEATYRLLHAETDMAYHLHCFGDYLADREGYRTHRGIEAVHYFLMLRHGWTPAEIRAMHPNDLCFAMQEEMHGWTVPREALPVASAPTP